MCIFFFFYVFQIAYFTNNSSPSILTFFRIPQWVFLGPLVSPEFLQVNHKNTKQST